MDHIVNKDGTLNLEKLIEELNYASNSLSSAQTETNPVTTGARVNEVENDLRKIIYELTGESDE